MIRTRTPAHLLLAAALSFAPLVAVAAPESAKAKVVSVRGRRIYVELKSAKSLEPGQSVTVKLQSREIKGTLLAGSTKFLLILLPKGERPPRAGTSLSVVGEGVGPPPAPAVEVGPARKVAGSNVSIGRRQPTLQEFISRPPPTFEKVPFRGVAQKSEDELRPEARLEGELAEGEIAPPANEVSGEFEVGIDSAFRNNGPPDRKTPYGKLRLEIRHLGGSERASFIFYGSVRHPVDGGPDWTGSREEQLNARLSAMALRLESKQGEPGAFTDRLELTLGRDIVRDVVEAGVVDGAQLGVKFGAVTGFFFTGFGASPNPRPEDYDSPIFGGGLRVAKALGHTGAIRFSLAYVHEVFRGEGERGFIESHADVRFGGFGARGALVLDRFSNLQDDTFDGGLKVTTGELLVYTQISETVRLEAGYRERRPIYTAELIKVDLDDELATGVGNGAGASPRVGDFFEESARRNIWTTLSLDGEMFGLMIRGDHLQARESRDSTGAELAPRLKLSDHWFTLTTGYRHRQSGNGFKRHVTEYTARLDWRYRGEYVTPSLAIAYRRTAPLNQGDERLALRAAIMANFSGGFGLRAYLQYDGVVTAVRSPRIAAERDVVFMGLAASIRF